MELYYELINTRYENNRALVITINMSLGAIRMKYNNSGDDTGDAIASRILEMCKGIKMGGADWRKKAIE